MPTDQKAIHAKTEAKEKEGKKCPKCSAVMVRKDPTRGKYAGKHFFACSGYPTCKTIIPIEEAL